MQNHKSQPPERKPGWPDGDDDVINKYGTYEGLSEQEAQEQLNAAERWKKK